MNEFPEKLVVNEEEVSVFHIMQLPAVRGIEAKYDPQEMKLYINMPWDQNKANQIQIIK
jgi:hypothetical protein